MLVGARGARGGCGAVGCGGERGREHAGAAHPPALWREAHAPVPARQHYGGQYTYYTHTVHCTLNTTAGASTLTLVIGRIVE